MERKENSPVMKRIPLLTNGVHCKENIKISTVENILQQFSRVKKLMKIIVNFTIFFDSPENVNLVQLI